MKNATKPGLLINRRLTAVLSFALVWSASLHAQVVSGSLSGTVTDSLGAVIPGAKVTLIDRASH